MRPLVVLALALALTAPGCVESVKGAVDTAGRAADRVVDPFADRLRGEEPAPEGFEASWAEFVTPGFNRTYPFAIADDGATLNATFILRVLSPLPTDLPASPGQVEVFLQGPDGSPVTDTFTLDFRAPQANATLQNATAGSYAVLVTGDGFSNEESGARFNATVVVAYPFSSVK